MREVAGRLSERVCFESRDDVRGLAGEQSGQWRTAFVCWADVGPVAQAGQLPVAADTRHAARRWRIEVRAGRAVTPGMRVRWRGQLLAVTGIEASSARDAVQTLWAEDFGPSAG